MSVVHFSLPVEHVALLEIDNPPMNALGRAARAALHPPMASSQETNIRR